VIKELRQISEKKIATDQLWISEEKIVTD